MYGNYSEKVNDVYIYHALSKHGTRYAPDRSGEHILNFHLQLGEDRIRSWLKSRGVSPKQIDSLESIKHKEEILQKQAKSCQPFCARLDPWAHCFEVKKGEVRSPECLVQHHACINFCG